MGACSVSLIGFHCPQGTPTAGNDNAPEWCFKECPHPCQPRAFLHTYIKLTRSNPHRGTMLSATSLKGCVRKLKLERSEPYFEEPQKLFWSARGTLIHSFLEIEIDGVETERRVYKRVEGGPNGYFWISGQIDYYEHASRAIEDYKSINEKGIYYVNQEGAKEDHVWQQNIYRWLLMGGRLQPKDYRRRGKNEQEFEQDILSWPVIEWPVEKVQLHYVTMQGVTSTGTDVRVVHTQFKPPPEFPTEISRRLLERARNGKPQYEVILRIPPAPLKPFDEIESFVKAAAPERIRALLEPDYMPAGVLNDKEKSWECSYCAVKRFCDQIEAERKQSEPIQLPLDQEAA
jgi:hypothetical protein